MNAVATKAAPAAPTVQLDFPRPNVACVRIGDPAAKQSILDGATIEALEKTLTKLEAGLGLKGAIFTGCAPGRFLAGADVNAIGAVPDATTGEALSRRGQALFTRIARLSFNTVAAIDGVCLGGGLELALACKVRIASDSPKTRLGLPEVQLGIVPGWGGTQRLPRKIGLSAALPWILTGRRFDARSAKRAGVVDRVVPAERIFDLALETASADAARSPRRSRPILTRLLDGTSLGRAVTAAVARRKVLAETRGRYPAPLLAIDVARRGLSTSLEKGLELEAKALGASIASPVSKELVRLFFLFEGAKKAGDKDAAEKLSRAAVIGAGVMGAGIAALLAEHGIQTRLRDTRPAALVDAVARMRDRLMRRVRKRRMKDAEARAALDALQPTLDGSGVDRAEIVVEAIAEDLAAKRALFRDLAARVSGDACLATNTSSLSITAIQAEVPQPERVVGIHFFNPVEKMPLVEIVRGEKTSPATIALAAGLALRLGKTPIVVADRPGFLVNRILAPYIAEATRLLAEGLSLTEIDRVAVGEGMPMGPFALLDEVGLDVAGAVSRVLVAGLGERFRATDHAERLIAASRLGAKTGAGFYRHASTKPGAKRDADPAVPAILGVPWANAKQGAHSAALLADAGDRLMLSIAAESLRALEEGVAASSDDVDLGAVAGFGYPPFRGGPLRDLANRGDAGRARRAELNARYGPRF